jgi:hypothetical protein
MEVEVKKKRKIMMRMMNPVMMVVVVGNLNVDHRPERNRLPSKRRTSKLN